MHIFAFVVCKAAYWMLHIWPVFLHLVETLQVAPDVLSGVIILMVLHLVYVL